MAEELEPLRGSIEFTDNSTPVVQQTTKAFDSLEEQIKLLNVALKSLTDSQNKNAETLRKEKQETDAAKKAQSDYNTELRKSEAASKSFIRQAAAMAAGMIGYGGLQSAMQAVRTTIADTIKEYASIEKSMVLVNNRFRNQGVNLTDLKDQVGELSIKYGMKAGGLAEALNIIAPKAQINW
jgi:septal ring factor EnvC (AmiA/AmiB activator)